MRLAIDALLERQAVALRALTGGVPVRDRVRTATHACLDHIASHPAVWALPRTAPGTEPRAAVTVRAHARADDVGFLDAA